MQCAVRVPEYKSQISHVKSHDRQGKAEEVKGQCELLLKQEDATKAAAVAKINQVSHTVKTAEQTSKEIQASTNQLILTQHDRLKLGLRRNSNDPQAILYLFSFIINYFHGWASVARRQPRVSVKAGMEGTVSCRIAPTGMLDEDEVSELGLLLCLRLL